jgi:hypothetical protein
LNYSVSDSASGVNTTWYNLDNGGNTTLSSNITLTINSSGTYTLYIFANDNAGLENGSEYVQFYVSVNKTVLFSNFNGYLTTNFSLYDDQQLESLTNVVLHIPDYGKIEFLETINISDLVTDLNSYVSISNDNIYLDSSNLPNFNKQSRLQLFNLTFTHPRILKDGSLCPSDVCTEESYVNNVLTFNVTGFYNFSAEETTAEHPSVPPSGGGGGGGGGVYSDFTVHPNSVTVKLRQGDTDNKHITIKNIGGSRLVLELKPSMVHNLVTVTPAVMVLEPGQEGEATLLFNIGKDEPPGVYPGTLTVDGGFVKKIVFIVVEVESKEKLLDVKLEILPRYKVVNPGESVYANIEFFNMGSPQRVDVTLRYGVKDTDGNTFVLESGVVSVETQASIVRYVKLPLDIKPGSYIMFVEAYYDGTVAASSDQFEVLREELPAAQVVKNPYLLIGAIFIFLTLVMMFIVIIKLIGMTKRRKKKDVGNVPAPLHAEPETLVGQEKLLEDAYKAGLISEDAYRKDKSRIRNIRNK